jgi:RHS repeat-associated protein
VVANRQTVDASGNVTDSVTSIDTGAHTTTVSTTTAGTTGTQIVVTTAGLAIQTTGFDGLTATTSYDSLWRAHQRTDARGNAVTYAYFDDTTSSTTPWLGTVSDGSNTTVASYGYDGAGRVAALTDADGHTVYTAYDDRDHITQQWGDGTNPVSYSYDVYGARETMSTYRGGSGWTTSAWPSGGTGDADTTTWTYDPGSGLLASKVDAALHGVSYTYNARGQTATRTWARGVVATYAYSSVTGELTGVSYSDGTPSVSYAYTRSGQLDTAADGTGARSFVYDAGDPLLLAAVDLPAYYGSRILTEQRNSDGLLPGRPTGVQLGTSSAPAADLSQTYYYNNQGRFDHLSASTAGASAVTFDYAYLANSTLVSGIAVSGSSFAVNRSYEAHRDLLASIQTAWGAVSGSNPALAQFDYTYDARWQRLSAQQEGAAFADYYSPGTSYSSVYTYYAYDSQGQLRTSDMYRGTAPSVGNSPSAGDELPGRRFEYRYDNAGNRTKSGPADPAGPSGSADDNYTANNLNQYSARENNTVRIVGNANPSDSMTAGGATINQVDRNFGGTLVPSNGTAPVAGSVAVTADLISAGVTKSITRNYTVAKQSEALGYDVDGNLTSDGMWDYTYDAENRLSQMETSTAAQAVGIAHQILQFSYDYLGRRVEKKVYANSTGGTPTLDHRYIYDGWNLVAETDGSGTLLRTYVWGLDLSGSLTASGGVGALLELTNVSGSSTSNYYASMDGAGNVAGLVKASDGSLAAVYEYSGYGEPMRAEVFDAAVGDNPFRFSSRYTDLESGLVYYGSRYYSVTLGRFINRDPIEEAGGVNLYGFVGNNPVNGWDVLGNDPSSTVFVPPGLSPGGYWVIPLPADYDGSLGAGTVYTDSNGRKYLFVKTSDADEPADYASIFDWSDTQGNQAFGFADSQPNPELVALSQLMSAQANVRQKTLSDQSRQIRSQVDGKKAMELAGHSSAPNKVATSPLEFALSNPGLTAQVMWQIASKDRVAQLELNLIGGRLIGAAAGVFGEAFSWAKGLFGAAETGPLARTMGTVNGIASKAGVDLEGLNVQIINDPELEGRGLYGWTDGEQLHLYPDAFENEEQLVRTLGHERTHVFQVDTFGPVNDSAQLQMNEAGAQAAEEAYWQYYLMNK